jgi:hypothetical protein
MSLQTVSHSQTHRDLQALPFLGAHTSLSHPSRLDPITSQIVKTQDAALEVMLQIESGAAAKFWEAQKKLPSVTWLGNLVDRVFGWGKYYLSTGKIATSRDLLENEDLNEQPCTYDPPRAPAIARFNITTSLDVQKYPNNSCFFIDPIGYRVRLQAYMPNPPDNIVCKVVGCVIERLNLCQPACLPCLNATDQERIDTLNTTYSYTIFSAKWLVQIYADSDLNAWKTDQIYLLFNETLQECIKQPNGNAIYALLIIPVAIGGGIGMAVCLHKKRNRKLEYDSLEAGEAN